MKRRPWLTALAVALVTVLSAVGREVGGRVAELRDVALEGNPYWVPSQAVLLYLLLPLVVLSITALCLAPGVLLVRNSKAANGTIERVLLLGGMLSLVVVSSVTAILQSLVGWSPTGPSFVAVLLGLSAVAYGVGASRWIRGPEPSTAPPTERDSWRAMGPLLTLLLTVLLLFLPKFLWESFNGDGAHGFESARLLLSQPLPFFPPTADGRAFGFPGVTSMLFTYPSSWWIRLFGEWESAARLPYLGQVALLYCGIVVTVEAGGQRMPLVERWLVAMSLLVYSAAMAYSASYDPYVADLALPATQDTLAMVCVLGFIIGNIERRISWEVLFGTLALLALPNSLLLMGFWLAACWWVGAATFRRTLLQGGLVVGMSLLLGVLVPIVAVLVGSPAPGGEYGLLSLLSRFAVLQFSDWPRLWYMVLPGGLLPALALGAWSRHDRAARALTRVTLGYFVFFYVQAHISLHHFVPAMVLPIVVLWRTAPTLSRAGRRSLWYGAMVAGGLAAWLVAPERGGIYAASRAVGSGVEDRLGAAGPYDSARMARRKLLQALLPEDWRPEVPERSYGGSSFAWYYYSAHRPPGSPTENIIQFLADPPPAGMVRWASDSTYALYTHVAAREALASLRPLSPPGSALLHVPRGVLFGAEPPPDRIRFYSVEGVLRWLGIDTEALRRRVFSAK